MFLCFVYNRLFKLFSTLSGDRVLQEVGGARGQGSIGGGLALLSPRMTLLTLLPFTIDFIKLDFIIALIWCYSMVGAAVAIVVAVTAGVAVHGRRP